MLTHFITTQKYRNALDHYVNYLTEAAYVRKIRMPFKRPLNHDRLKDLLKAIIRYMNSDLPKSLKEIKQLERWIRNIDKKRTQGIDFPIKTWLIGAAGPLALGTLQGLIRAGIQIVVDFVNAITLKLDHLGLGEYAILSCKWNVMGMSGRV